MGSASHRRLLFALLFASFVLRIGFCVMRGTLGVSPPENYREYVIVGTKLSEIGTIVTPLLPEGGRSTPSFILPPAYTLLVASTYRLLGAETRASTFVLQILNAFATTLVVLLVYDVARRVAGVKAGWVAAIVAAVHPSLIVYTDFIWDTNLFTLAVAQSVWFSCLLGERRRPAPAYLLFGLWLGAVAMLNPALTVCYPFLVLWPLVRNGGWRVSSKIAPIALAVTGWAIALTPWTIRNYNYFDKLIYVRGGFWIEMWLGVCPEADDEGALVFERHFPLKNSEAAARVRDAGESAWVKECETRARAALSANPVRYAKLLAMRALDYWTGTAFGHRVKGGSFLPRSTGRLAMMALYCLELAAILILIWATPKTTAQRRDAAFLVVLLVAFSLIYCLTHVQVRYRAPMEPVAILLFALLARGAARSRDSQRKDSIS